MTIEHKIAFLGMPIWKESIDGTEKDEVYSREEWQKLEPGIKVKIATYALADGTTVELRRNTGFIDSKGRVIVVSADDVNQETYLVKDNVSLVKLKGRFPGTTHSFNYSPSPNEQE